MNNKQLKIVAIVPAKSSSERVEDKNNLIFGGEELYIRALRKLTEIDLIDEVYLDSDSKSMIKYAMNRLPIKALLRDKIYSDNKTDGHILLLQAAKKVKADIYIQVLCTSPFLSKDTILEGINNVISGNSSSISVSVSKRYGWKNGQPCYNKKSIPNSKDLEDSIFESMSLYVITSKELFESKLRFGNHPKLIFTDDLENIDINTRKDLEFSNIVMDGILYNEQKRFNFIKNILSSPLLSDTADEMGVNIVLPLGFISNINSKIMGRAKTLIIRNLDKGDDWKGIYDSLKLYDYINYGDIIMVTGNEDHAFFGEMNAGLSIRSGAIGTIVNGVTRDLDATIKMGYPVYSRGVYCKDVRKRSVIEDINVKTNIGGVEIDVGDIIFADKEGVCVLPKKSAEVIIQNAISKCKNEVSIYNDIMDGDNYKDIINKRGYF